MPAAIGTPALLWPLLVLLGGLMGGLYTLSLALIGERFRGADLTQANTAFVMTFQLGAIVGPPYAGALMHLLGVAAFPLTLIPPLAPAGGWRCSPGAARSPPHGANLDSTPFAPMLRGRSLTDFEDCRPWRSPPPF